MASSPESDRNTRPATSVAASSARTTSPAENPLSKELSEYQKRLTILERGVDSSLAGSKQMAAVYEKQVKESEAILSRRAWSGLTPLTAAYNITKDLYSGDYWKPAYLSTQKEALKNEQESVAKFGEQKQGLESAKKEIAEIQRLQREGKSEEAQRHLSELRKNSLFSDIAGQFRRDMTAQTSASNSFARVNKNLERTQAVATVVRDGTSTAAAIAVTVAAAPEVALVGAVVAATAVGGTTAIAGNIAEVHHGFKTSDQAARDALKETGQSAITGLTTAVGLRASTAVAQRTMRAIGEGVLTRATAGAAGSLAYTNVQTAAGLAQGQEFNAKDYIIDVGTGLLSGGVGAQAGLLKEGATSLTRQVVGRSVEMTADLGIGVTSAAVKARTHNQALTFEAVVQEVHSATVGSTVGEFSTRPAPATSVERTPRSYAEQRQVVTPEGLVFSIRDSGGDSAGPLRMNMADGGDGGGASNSGGSPVRPEANGEAKQAPQYAGPPLTDSQEALLAKITRFPPDAAAVKAASREPVSFRQHPLVRAAAIDLIAGSLKHGDVVAAKSMIEGHRIPQQVLKGSPKIQEAAEVGYLRALERDTDAAQLIATDYGLPESVTQSLTAKEVARERSLQVNEAQREKLSKLVGEHIAQTGSGLPGLEGLTDRALIERTIEQRDWGTGLEAVIAAAKVNPHIHDALVETYYELLTKYIPDAGKLAAAMDLPPEIANSPRAQQNVAEQVSSDLFEYRALTEESKKTSFADLQESSEAIGIDWNAVIRRPEVVEALQSEGGQFFLNDVIARRVFDADVVKLREELAAFGIEPSTLSDLPAYGELLRVALIELNPIGRNRALDIVAALGVTPSLLTDPVTRESWREAILSDFTADPAPMSASQAMQITKHFGEPTPGELLGHVAQRDSARAEEILTEGDSGGGLGISRKSLPTYVENLRRTGDTRTLVALADGFPEFANLITESVRENLAVYNDLTRTPSERELARQTLTVLSTSSHETFVKDLINTAEVGLSDVDRNGARSDIADETRKVMELLVTMRRADTPGVVAGALARGLLSRERGTEYFDHASQASETPVGRLGLLLRSDADWKNGNLDGLRIVESVFSGHPSSEVRQSQLDATLRLLDKGGPALAQLETLYAQWKGSNQSIPLEMYAPLHLFHGDGSAHSSLLPKFDQIYQVARSRPSVSNELSSALTAATRMLPEHRQILASAISDLDVRSVDDVAKLSDLTRKAMFLSVSEMESEGGRFRVPQSLRLSSVFSSPDSNITSVLGRVDNAVTHMIQRVIQHPKMDRTRALQLADQWGDIEPITTYMSRFGDEAPMAKHIAEIAVHSTSAAEWASYRYDPSRRTVQEQVGHLTGEQLEVWKKSSAAELGDISLSGAKRSDSVRQRLEEAMLQNNHFQPKDGKGEFVQKFTEETIRNANAAPADRSEHIAKSLSDIDTVTTDLNLVIAGTRAPQLEAALNDFESVASTSQGLGRVKTLVDRVKPLLPADERARIDAALAEASKFEKSQRDAGEKQICKYTANSFIDADLLQQMRGGLQALVSESADARARLDAHGIPAGGIDTNGKPIILRIRQELKVAQAVLQLYNLSEGLVGKNRIAAEADKGGATINETLAMLQTYYKDTIVAQDLSNVQKALEAGSGGYGRRRLAMVFTDNAQMMWQIGKYPIGNGSCQDYAGGPEARALMAYTGDAHIKGNFLIDINKLSDSQRAAIDRDGADVMLTFPPQDLLEATVGRSIVKAISNEQGKPVIFLEPTYTVVNKGSTGLDNYFQLFTSEFVAQPMLSQMARGGEGVILRVPGSANPEGQYEDSGSGNAAHPGMGVQHRAYEMRGRYIRHDEQLTEAEQRIVDRMRSSSHR